MIDIVEASLQEARKGLAELLESRETLAAIAQAGALLVGAFERKGHVYACGNGGSMCDAMHFAEELTGRYRRDRPALGAAAIGDPSHLSCVGNDYGYEQVFARYLEGHGRPGDCLVALSTSGTSRNVLAAAKAARALGMRTILLTGRPGSELEALADACICTPAGAYADRVQELHIKVLHILIELVERHFFPGNYA
jgi:D-sedoheptulose 7-phosphate isomerase